MAVAHRSSSSNSAASGNVTVALPAGVTDGDFLLAFVYARGPFSAVDAIPSINTPTGWSLLLSVSLNAILNNEPDERLNVYTRIASSEPANYTWVVGGSSPSGTVGGISAFTGVLNANPVSISGGSTEEPAGGVLSSFTTALVAVPHKNSMIVACAAFTSSFGFSAFTPYDGVAWARASGSMGSGCCAQVNYELLAAAGNAQAGATVTGSDVDSAATIILALTPAEEALALDTISSTSQVFQAATGLSLAPSMIPATSQAFAPTMGLTQALARIESRVKLDFKNNWDAAIAFLTQYGTFTRAGTATYFDAAGNLQTASANVPRKDHDPITLAVRGLLDEPGRTNGVPNNSMTGAAAGTPGTMPTGWGASAPAELTREIVGVFTENGITYIEIRISGTVTAQRDWGVTFSPITSIAATPGQVWAGSVYLRRVGGSLANLITLGSNLQAYNSGVFLSNIQFNSVLSTLTNAPLVSQRVLTSGAAPASTTHVALGLFLRTAASGAVDVTFRIGMPQVEAGAFTTSVIPTSTVAVTRGSDIPSLTNVPWVSSTEGTMVAAVKTLPGTSATTRRVACFNDGTINQRTEFQLSTSNNFNFFIAENGTFPVSLNVAGATENLPLRGAGAFKVNDFALSVNGSAVATDTAGAMQTITRLDLCATFGGSGELSGWLEDFEYYPTRRSNADLQALSLPKVVLGLGLSPARIPSTSQTFEPAKTLVQPLQRIESTAEMFDMLPGTVHNLDMIVNSSQLFEPDFHGVWRSAASDTDGWSQEASAANTWTPDAAKTPNWS